MRFLPKNAPKMLKIRENVPNFSKMRQNFFNFLKMRQTLPLYFGNVSKSAHHQIKGTYGAPNFGLDTFNRKVAYPPYSKKANLIKFKTPKISTKSNLKLAKIRKFDVMFTEPQNRKHLKWSHSGILQFLSDSRAAILYDNEGVGCF